MKTKLFAIPLLILNLCLPAFALAAVIHLKSGVTVEGPILERNDKYIIVEFSGVNLTYFLDEIDSIEENAVEEPSSAPKREGADINEYVKNIIAKSKNIGSVKCDETINTYFNDDPAKIITSYTLRIWQKMPFAKTYLKTSPDSPVTIEQETIVRPEGIYIRTYPEEGYDRFAGEADWSHIEGILKPLKEIETGGSLKLLGTETIDGKLATIIEYPVTNEGESFVSKVWLWDEKGLPLKTETVGEKEGTNYTTKTEYKNFNFEDIPDNVFEIS